MVPKIVTFLITFLINVAAGIVMLFGMLLALNGFNESDGIYGLITYVLLAVLITLAASSLAAYVVHLLVKRQYHSAVAASIAIVLFSVPGVVLIVVCTFVGILIAEFVRVNF